MEKTSMQQRQEVERRIEAALAKLDPQGEMDGTMLRRYTEWDEVRQIPGEVLGRTCAHLENEAVTREGLPGDSYFNCWTGYQKWALYQRALAMVEEQLQKMGCDMNSGVTFSQFKLALNLCVPRAAEEMQEPSAADVTEAPKPQKVKRKKAATFVPPTEEDVVAYIKEKGYNVDARQFITYYEAGDWIDSKGAPVRNWKQRVISWNREGRAPTPGGTKARNAVPEAKAIAPEHDVLLNVTEHVPLAERRRRMSI